MSARNDYVPVSEQKDRVEEKAKLAKAKKSLKKQEEQERKLRELAEQEHVRHVALSQKRWVDSLSVLSTNLPQIKNNPWVIIQTPIVLHDLLDSLTEVLANLAKHEEEIDTVRSVLQSVYEAFVDLGQWAKYQPAFYITNPSTLRRLVRLLEQVAHKGSDKALFPNVLSLLSPTFARPSLYPALANSGIVHCLMSFVRTDWLPSPPTLQLILSILEQLSSSEEIRQAVMNDAGFPKLRGLAEGKIEGFTRQQAELAKRALKRYPVESSSLSSSSSNLSTISPLSPTSQTISLSVSSIPSSSSPSTATSATTTVASES